jgi:ATP-dependent Clp protease ATP-binding subunit ClpX
MFDIPTEDGIAEVVVDRDVVEGRKEPVRVLKGKEEAA